MYGLPKSVCAVSVIQVCLYMLLPYLCFCMSYVISSFKSLRAVSHVFSLLVLFLCVIVHTMWSGNGMQLLCILPWYVVIVFHQYKVCKNYVDSRFCCCYVVGQLW